MDNKYKYIKNGFPYLENENVFEYDNIFNYNQWGENTVIRVMHVPWDRDYSNVVYFDNKEDRDKWASENTVTQYKLTTAINIQPDGTIKLPIPFDVLAKCNYIVVEYAYAPVEYEQQNRISKMGYFIDNVMQQAPNTTQARVSLDYWYTFIYDIDITYLDLERGHAPMAATSADYYLQNPINRNEYLLTPDVNFSNDARNRIKQAAEWIANNGENYAVMACTGNVSSNYWGTVNTRDMQVPGVAAPGFFGVKSGYDYIAVKISDLDSFIAQCNGARPQFLQTIQGLFIVPGKLINITGTTTWSGINNVTLYYIDTAQKYTELISLSKSDFDYDDKYSNIAKLYTFPYCHLEITDENGNVSTVYVENTTGTIGINATLNLIYPFLGLDIIPVGIGGSDSITSEFGWSSTKTFAHSGDWYSLIKRYEIPAFIVSQSQNDRAKFNRFFPNAQDNTALENAYSSAVASYTANYDNTMDNAYAANVQNALSDRNKIRYELETGINYAVEAYSQAGQIQNANRAINETQQGLSTYLAADNNAIAVTAGAGNAILGATATGSLPGAAASLASSTFNGIASLTAMTNNANYSNNSVNQQRKYFNDMYGGMTAQWDAGADYTFNAGQYTGATWTSLIGRQTALTNTYNRRINEASIAQADATAQTNTVLVGGGTGRTFNTDATETNEHVYTGTAPRTRDTAAANATRDRATALAAIDNGNRAQGVEAPAVYGTNSGSSTAATRPMGLFVNIATQSKAAIKAAGDQFLRYGYMLEQAWTPEKWQVMKYFTYWKARDIWISGRGITIEDATEIIKNIFLNGTTIWDNPDHLGNVSIYDNI